MRVQTIMSAQNEPSLYVILVHCHSISHIPWCKIMLCTIRQYHNSLCVSPTLSFNITYPSVYVIHCSIGNRSHIPYRITYTLQIVIMKTPNTLDTLSDRLFGLVCTVHQYPPRSLLSQYSHTFVCGTIGDNQQLVLETI